MQRGSLVDVINHLLDRGVTLQGDSMVTLAGVDLIYLRLNVLLASAETMRRIEAEGAAAGQARAMAPAMALAPATAPVTAYSRQPLAAASPVEARRTLPPSGGADAPAGVMEPPAGRLTFTPAGAPPLAAGQSPTEQPTESTSDRTGASRSLAQLIVTLAEFLRQIIERQALRRVEGGGLHDDQIEKIGLALADLERSMKEMRDLFDIEERDLELDLGPLGQIP